MASRNPSRSNEAIPRSASGTGRPSVRQNLFGSRRPPTNPVASSSISSVQVLHTDAAASTKDDILVRDEQGNISLDVPNMAPLPRDEAKEERENELRLLELYRTHQVQHTEDGTSPDSHSPQSPSSNPRTRNSPHCPFCTIPKPSTRKEWRQLEEHALNALTNHHEWVDLRGILQKVLAAKVASLDDDKWMFGEETDADVLL